MVCVATSLMNSGMAAAVKGNGLAWGSPPFSQEGLHVVAGGCCPRVFKMHHFIS